MRYAFGLYLALLAYSAPAAGKHYRIEPIVQIAEGALGSKKLYFELACNQVFLQILTEAVDGQSLRTGILTEFRPEDCNDPSRTTFARLSSSNRQVVPVGEFSEVWRCSGSCFTPGGPDMPPYNRAVSAYGTSEQQATEYLGCTPPYLQDLACWCLDL